eukprot:6398380-Karenia_brevis.AAC.1
MASQVAQATILEMQQQQNAAQAQPPTAAPEPPAAPVLAKTSLMVVRANFTTHPNLPFLESGSPQ